MSEMSNLSKNMDQVTLNNVGAPGHNKMSTKLIIKKSNKLLQKRGHTKSCSVNAPHVGPSKEKEQAKVEEDDDDDDDDDSEEMYGISEQDFPPFALRNDNNSAASTTATTITTTTTEAMVKPKVSTIVNRLQASQSIQEARMKRQDISMKNFKRHRRVNQAQRIALTKNVGDGSGLKWGGPMESNEDVPVALDERDPNYTSDNDGDDDDLFDHFFIVDTLSDDDFERLFNDWMDEYLVNGDLINFADLLYELAPTKAQLKRIPSFCFSRALDQKPVQRELLSKLLSFVADGKRLGPEFLCDSFDCVLINDLREFYIDLPESPEMVGTFFARAVADGIIPPNYILHRNSKAKDDGELAARVFKKAHELLSLPHCYAHLDSVWLNYTGLTSDADVHQPVKKLIKVIRNLLTDYVDTVNIGHVEHTLSDLAIPHFLHEFVYQAILLAFQNNRQTVRDSLLKLLSHLYHIGCLTIDQIENGINRIYDDMEDLLKTLPHAPFFMEELLKRGIAESWIPPEIMKNKPKMRRRFISENFQ